MSNIGANFYECTRKGGFMTTQKNYALNDSS